MDSISGVGGKRFTLRGALFAAVAVLAAGCALQLALGPVPWRLAAWPVNALLLAMLVIALAAMHALRGRVKAFLWLGSLESALGSIGLALVLNVALGMVEQSSQPSAPWHRRLASSWPFVLAYSWMALALGMAVLRVGSRRWTARTVAFMLSHAGLLAVLVASALGYADVEHLRLKAGMASLGYEPQEIAHRLPDGEPVRMPFALALRGIDIEEHEAPAGAPRMVRAGVTVYDCDGGSLLADTVVAVNSPVDVGGWTLYITGYDRASDATRYASFEMVRDPWLPAVRVGIFMMLAGALSLLFFTKPKSK